MNDTQCPVQIPGFTHNGDCNLICKPTDWKDIATFFLGNYGAHVATVIGRPGQSNMTWVFTLVLALCFPGAGVLAGLNAILSRAFFAPTELIRAARAGALCIVVKVDAQLDAVENEDVEASRQSSECRRERPANVGQSVEILPDVLRDPETEGSAGSGNLGSQGSVEGNQRSISRIGDNATLDGRPDEVFPSSFTATQVHGVTRLPAGYRLLVLPPWTTFEADGADDETDDETQSTHPRSAAQRLKASLAEPFRSRTKFNSNSTVPCSFNLIKVLISIGQLFFAISTLFQTRGNQIEVFGYAAFGLTVAPYFWMSFINLLGNLMCPQYTSMFVVNSPALDDLLAEVADKDLSHRYRFEGMVGRISRDTQERVLDTNGYLLKCTTALEIFFSRLNPETSPEVWVLVYRAVAALAISAVPIAIVGGISRFDPGRSVASQRVWTMIWLCIGPLIGVGYGMWVLPLFESWPVLWRSLMRKPGKLGEGIQVVVHSKEGASNEEQENSGPGDANSVGTLEGHEEDIWTWVDVFRFALAAGYVSMYMVPAIGGLVVVGQMLVQYGTCMKLD